MTVVERGASIVLCAPRRDAFRAGEEARDPREKAFKEALQRGMDRSMRVLVTGFGTFLSHRENPSDELARSLGGSLRGEVELVSESPLPVVFGGAARRALEAAARERVDGVLAIGLASTAGAVRVEQRAKNRASSEDADADGVCAKGMLAEPNGAALLDSPVDAETFAAVVRAHGVAANASDDAGGYVCNDVYYRLLAAAGRGAGPRTVLFVHVPSAVDPRTGHALLEAVAATFPRALGSR